MTDAKTGQKVAPLPAIFSAIGGILAVYEIIVNDWSGAVLGTFWCLAFFPDTLLRRLTLKIFHRFGLLAIGVLGYYVSSSIILVALMLIVGAVGLVDAIRLIIKRNR